VILISSRYILVRDLEERERYWADDIHHTERHVIAKDTPSKPCSRRGNLKIASLSSFNAINMCDGPALAQIVATDKLQVTKMGHLGKILPHSRLLGAPCLEKKEEMKWVEYKIRRLKLRMFAYTRDASPKCRLYRVMAVRIYVAEKTVIHLLLKVRSEIHSEGGHTYLLW
jgi:hypothetical protein